MRLSTKLSLGLFAIILLLIVGQIYVSKDIVRDLNSLNYNPSRENLLNSKTYKHLELSAFNSIQIETQDVRIVKGERYEVFYNSVLHSEPQLENGKLIVKGIEQRTKVYIYIFLPDLQSLEVANTWYNNVGLFGFSGKNTKIVFETPESIEHFSYLNLHTDLSEIDLLLKRMEIYLNVEKDVEKLNVSLSNACLNMRDLSNTVQNFNLQMKGGGFDIKPIKPDLLRNIHLNGTGAMRGGIGGSLVGDFETLECDTLQIDITASDYDAGFNLSLPQNIKAQSASIQKSDNVSLIGGEYVEAD